jgi:hypothetical protein
VSALSALGQWEQGFNAICQSSFVLGDAALEPTGRAGKEQQQAD